MRYVFLCLLFTTAISCAAQNNALEIVSAQKGNTGFRGRVPKEDINKPNEGKDFYLIQLKAKKNCTIKVVGLQVHKGDFKANQLFPVNNEGQTTIKLKKGESCELKAELSDKAKESLFKGDYPVGSGRLDLKIGKQTVWLDIVKFEEILPN